MTIRITRGAGIAVEGKPHSEVFNIGKDWLLWEFDNNDGHWFAGKREAMRFLKYMREHATRA